MAYQVSELEKAINTLVTNFHSASADKSYKLKPNEFKSLLSAELPNFVKIRGLDSAFKDALKQMGVKDGEKINFKHFSKLVHNLAMSQYEELRPKSSWCSVM